MHIFGKSITIKDIEKFLVLLFIFCVGLQTRYIFYIPTLGNVGVEYGTVSVYATEIIAFLGILTSLFLSFNKTKYKKFLLEKKWLWLIVLIVSTTICTTDYKNVTAFYLFRFYEMIVIGFWLYYVHIPIRKLLFSMMFGFLFHIILAYSQLIFQNQIAFKWLGLSALNPDVRGISVIEFLKNTEQVRFLRVYGGFPHPNILGGYSAFLIIILYLYAYKYKMTEKVKRSILLFLCLLHSILIISFSRSAWLALLFVLVLIIIKKRIFSIDSSKTLFLKKIAVYSLVIWILGVACFFPQFQTRFGFNQRLETRSLSERIELSQNSLELVQKYSWWGSGLGTYSYALYDYYLENEILEKDDVYYMQPVHIIYVILAVELGLFRLFFCLFILLFYLLKQYKNENSFIKNHQNVLISCIFIGMLGLFDHYLLSFYSGNLLVVLIIVCALKLDKSQERFAANTV